VPSNKAVY